MGDSSSNTEQHGELEVNDTGKMLLLDYQNNLIETQLKERLSKDAAHSFIDQTVSDFDGVTFHISTPESKTQILLSIQIRCFRELVQYGAEQVLQREYGDFVTATEPGYDFSVLIDLTTLPDMSDEAGCACTQVRAFEAQRDGGSIRAGIPRILSAEGGGFEVHLGRSSARRLGRGRCEGDPLPRGGSHIHQGQPRPSHCYLRHHFPRGDRQSLRKGLHSGIRGCAKESYPKRPPSALQE